MRLLTVYAACTLLAAAAPALAEPAPEPKSAPKPTWDQVANIKEAASRIGKLHKARGVEAAYKHIDACYRTHSLAENYSAPFEACIAQDYLQTKMLVEIYARTPPETLKKYRTPPPQVLADTMGKRIVAAFSQYKVPVTEAEAFKVLVDKHGLPVFVGIVFPEVVKELNSRKPTDKSQKPKP
jgi:hypothetical protein